MKILRILLSDCRLRMHARVLSASCSISDYDHAISVRIALTPYRGGFDFPLYADQLGMTDFDVKAP